MGPEAGPRICLMFECLKQVVLGIAANRMAPTPVQAKVRYMIYSQYVKKWVAVEVLIIVFAVSAGKLVASSST